MATSKDLIKNKNIEITKGYSGGFGATSYDKKWAFEKVRELYSGIGVPLLNGERMEDYEKYKDFRNGIFSPELFKKVFDGKSPDNKDRGDYGKSEFKNTDFKHTRLLTSIIRIVEENIKSIPHNPIISSQDIISINKKLNEKFKMLGKQNAVDIINEVNRIAGLPPMSSDTDIDGMYSESKAKNKSVDMNVMTMVKNEISDNESMSIFEISGGLKDGVEMAHEMTSKHWLNYTKFKDKIADTIVSDLFDVNIGCYRWYTNLYNGLPEIQYIDISKLKTNSFQDKFGDDVTEVFYETEVSFGEFLKFVGQKLTPEENIEVYRRAQVNSGNGAKELKWSDRLKYYGQKINLGIAEVTVQEYENDRYYDKVKVIYYIPKSSAFSEEMIVSVEDLQDMYRYDSNDKRAKSSFVIVRLNGMESMMDTLWVDFEKINVLYMEYLNSLSQYIPMGTNIALEAFEGLVDAFIKDSLYDDADDVQKANNRDNVMAKVLKSYKQRGAGLFKTTFEGEGGIKETLPNPTFIMPNNVISSLDGLLDQIFKIYNIMLMSAGLNNNRLAQDPKQHQSLSAINSASEASYSATKFLERLYNESVRQFIERCMYWNRLVITEFDKNLTPKTERAKVLSALIGGYGINLLELYNDMPDQDCSLIVDTKDTSAERNYIIQSAIQYEMNGVLDIGTSITLMQIENFNLMKLYLISCIKKKERLAIENQMTMNQSQQQAQQEAFAMQQQMEAQKMAYEKQLEYQKESQLGREKLSGQLETKDKIKNNRIEEERATKQIESENNLFR